MHAADKDLCTRREIVCRCHSLAPLAPPTQHSSLTRTRTDGNVEVKRKGLGVGRGCSTFECGRLGGRKGRILIDGLMHEWVGWMAKVLLPVLTCRMHWMHTLHIILRRVWMWGFQMCTGLWCAVCGCLPMRVQCHVLGAAAEYDSWAIVWHASQGLM